MNSSSWGVIATSESRINVSPCIHQIKHRHVMLASGTGDSAGTLRPTGTKGTDRLHGTRRNLRRAQSWRFEQPAAVTTEAVEAADRHWSEARAKSIVWAMGVSTDPRVVYLDTETTGFGP